MFDVLEYVISIFTRLYLIFTNFSLLLNENFIFNFLA